MSTPITIFIHTANIEGSVKRVNQFLHLIEKSDFFTGENRVFLCYVGNRTNAYYGLHPSVVVLHASPNLQDFELPTINILWNYAKLNSNTKILYLHTKGIGKPINDCIEDWTEYMLYFCVEKWKECIGLLDTNDTVGVDLLEEPLLHYSGNFWWANANYLKKLPNPHEFKNLEKYPNPLNSVRHNQEFWICYLHKAHACLWQSNINCYERDKHRYPRHFYDLKV
jgi:hypothetical protein